MTLIPVRDAKRRGLDWNVAVHTLVGCLLCRVRVRKHRYLGWEWAACGFVKCGPASDFWVLNVDMDQPVLKRIHNATALCVSKIGVRAVRMHNARWTVKTVPCTICPKYGLHVSDGRACREGRIDCDRAVGDCGIGREPRAQCHWWRWRATTCSHAGERQDYDVSLHLFSQRRKSGFGRLGTNILPLIVGTIIFL